MSNDDQLYKSLSDFINEANSGHLKTQEQGLTLLWNAQARNIQVAPFNLTREQCICLLKNTLDNLCNSVIAEMGNQPLVIPAHGMPIKKA